MNASNVRGARAEAACRLLNQTLGLHRMQAITAPASSVTRLAPPVFDGHQVQCQATFLRMISITEAFCADRLLELAEGAVSPEANPIRALMWERASTSAVSAWRSIRDAYRDWYEIRPDWTQLEQLVEARNAIAHGLGQLTRMQRTKRQSTVTKLNQANIQINGDRIVLDEVVLQDVKNVCVDLISELDSLVQDKTGDVS